MAKDCTVPVKGLGVLIPVFLDPAADDGKGRAGVVDAWAAGVAELDRNTGGDEPALRAALDGFMAVGV